MDPRLFSKPYLDPFYKKFLLHNITIGKENLDFEIL